MGSITPTINERSDRTGLATTALAFRVEIEAKGDYPRASTTGSVRGLVRDYIRHSSEFKETAHVECDREKGLVTFYGLPKEAIEAALDFASREMGFHKRFRAGPIEPIESRAGELPTPLRKDEEHASETEKELAEARRTVAALEEQLEKQKGENNKLLIERSGLQTRVEHLVEQTGQLQTALTKTQAELEAEKAKAPVPTILGPPELVTQWLPVGERILGRISELFQGKVPADISEYIAIATMDRFEYMQTALRAAGIQINNRPELDALLERVPWESSKMYAILYPGYEKARKELNFVNLIKRSGQEVPEVLSTEYDKIDTKVDQELLAEYERKRQEYLDTGNEHRDIAAELERKYQRAAGLRTLFTAEPSMPVFISIEKGSRKAEVRYPANGPTSLIGIAVTKALETVVSKEVSISESTPGKIDVTFSNYGRLPSLNIAHLLHKALLETDLAKLGLRITFYSAI